MVNNGLVGISPLDKRDVNAEEGISAGLVRLLSTTSKLVTLAMSRNNDIAGFTLHYVLIKKNVEGKTSMGRCMDHTPTHLADRCSRETLGMMIMSARDAESSPP
jgi:hypothetical protein